MSDIISLGLLEVAEAIKSKKLSASAVMRAVLDQIEKYEPKILAFLSYDPAKAMEQAEKKDKECPKKESALWGVPVTLKDAISTVDFPTTSASRILQNFRPVYDAFVTERLKEAGAIIIGKTNMDEFAMGSATENSAYQKTKNPWNLGRVPGGSSGGSAAAVASCECYASLGSDTGGSIRQPAAFCGCVGLKPTYGRVSRYGLFAFASSLDQIGPIARNVADVAQMLNVIAGHDARDNTSSPAKTEDFAAQLLNLPENTTMKGIRLGFPEDFFGEGLSKEVKDNCLNAIETAKSLGAEIVKIKLPPPEVATATYYIISMAEASSNLARYDGVRYGRRAPDVKDLQELYTLSRSQGFGQEVKRRVMLGSFVLSSGYYDAYFRKAAQTRRMIYNQYADALAKCDAICMPVAPVTAWELGAHEHNPLEAYLMDAYTLPANLAGLPGISFPAGLGKESGMPAGLQLVGARFNESAILKIAHILEQHLPKTGMPPMQF